MAIQTPEQAEPTPSSAAAANVEEMAERNGGQTTLGAASVGLAGTAAPANMSSPLGAVAGEAADGGGSADVTMVDAVESAASLQNQYELKANLAQASFHNLSSIPNPQACLPQQHRYLHISPKPQQPPFKYPQLTFISTGPQSPAPGGLANSSAPSPLPARTSTPMRNTANSEQPGGAGSRAASAHPPEPGFTMPAEAPAHGAPVRQYINTKVTGPLLEGMKLIAKDQPQDPLRVLGEYLIQRSKELEGTS